MAGNYPENVLAKMHKKIPPVAGRTKQSLTTEVIESVNAFELSFLHRLNKVNRAIIDANHFGVLTTKIKRFPILIFAAPN